MMNSNRFLAVFFIAALYGDVSASGNNSSDAVGNEEMSAGSYNEPLDPDFQPLANPDRKVSGAYYGIGLGLSCISHKLNAERKDKTEFSEKHSANQFDVSLIGGFGSAFYGRYYAGIEAELFKRLPKKKKRSSEIGSVYATDLGLSGLGVNMDVRFGYQFPQHGSLVYVTVGFARVIGWMEAYNNGLLETRMSFGSYFPTAGLGIEYKINQTINICGDVRITFGSKEKKYAIIDGNVLAFEAKPNRYAFRVSITKSI